MVMIKAVTIVLFHQGLDSAVICGLETVDQSYEPSGENERLFTSSHSPLVAMHQLLVGMCSFLVATFTSRQLGGWL